MWQGREENIVNILNPQWTYGTGPAFPVQSFNSSDDKDTYMREDELLLGGPYVHSRRFTCM